MQFYDVIKNRESIKEFKGTTVNKESISRMLNALMMSPSWKNNTSYKFILVDNENEKNILAESIMNDTEDAARAIRQAPLTAVVVADPAQSGNIEGREYYLVDGSIAMEHFVLAATNEGYGTCWIAALDEDKVRQSLNIPNNYRVVAMTPVGETAQRPISERKKDVREHVYLNSWGSAYTRNQSNKTM